MTIQLLSDYVLIEPVPIEDVTKSGLILIRSQTDTSPTVGKVITAGRGRYDSGVLITTVVKSGDKVMWHKFAGSEIEIDNTKYLLMHESDLTCVIK